MAVFPSALLFTNPCIHPLRYNRRQKPCVHTVKTLIFILQSTWNRKLKDLHKINTNKFQKNPVISWRAYIFLASVFLSVKKEGWFGWVVRCIQSIHTSDHPRCSLFRNYIYADDAYLSPGTAWFFGHWKATCYPHKRHNVCIIWATSSFIFCTVLFSCRVLLYIRLRSTHGIKIWRWKCMILYTFMMIKKIFQIFVINII
jgi:hypothetical protein